MTYLLVYKIFLSFNTKIKGSWACWYFKGHNFLVIHPIHDFKSFPKAQLHFVYALENLNEIVQLPSRHGFAKITHTGGVLNSHLLTFVAITSSYKLQIQRLIAL